MKIAFVEIAGFRGFRNRTRFEFPPGFAVLTGRNGAGKSTVLDAVDFILTGTINKYSVTNAKGGGLDEHIWWVGSTPAENHYVALGLEDEDGSLTTIRRSRFQGLEFSEADVVTALSVAHTTTAGFLATLARTSLIRDETIAALSVDLTGQSRFGELKAALGEVALPGLASRMEALKRAAGGSRDAQLVKVNSVKEELAKTLTTLAEARGLASRHTDVSEAQSIIAKLAPDAEAGGRDRSEGVRREVAARRQQLVRANELVTRLRELREKQTAYRQRTSPEAMALLQRESETERGRQATARTVLDAARQREEAERRSDELAAHMAELLVHGKAVGIQSGRCPLCEAERTEVEFVSAIGRAEAGLRARGSRLLEANDALRVALRESEETTRRLSEGEARILALNEEGAALVAQETALRAECEALGVDLGDLTPDALAKKLAARAEDVASLERALLILESSLAHDRVVELEAAVERLKGASEVESSEGALRAQAVDAVERIGKSLQEVRNQVLEEQFNTVLPVLQELYQRLRPHTEWREIAIDFGGRVRASLNFAVGDGRNPQFLFSSGQRRAAGLAFLLALHLSRPWCRLRSLLLDDPVQHIDDYRSLNLVEVLAAIRRTGRQVIIAVEDPALADLLGRRLGVSAIDRGRRFEITTGADGSSAIQDVKDVPPMSADALLGASA